MNGTTQDIARLLKCDIEWALKIQNRIEEEDGLDFSECTTREFNRAVRNADVYLKIERRQQAGNVR